MIVYGPVPSRRLGRSLGVNNIPPKICSYSCVYCQVGLTKNLSVTRQEFFKPEEIYLEAEAKIKELESRNESVDYITFVPDGEPTLDINLGKTIKMLKPLGVKIGVISNASLITEQSVRDDLMNADWVSLKIDSVYSDIWRKINRPHQSINFKDLLESIKQFAGDYKGTLVTETMLVEGVNDKVTSLYNTALFIKELNVNTVYMLVPMRPTASKIKNNDESNLQTAVEIYGITNPNFRLINYNEGSDFTYFNNPEQELLSIIAVHPMRKDAVESFLEKANLKWDFVEKLLNEKKIVELLHDGNSFYKNIN